MTARALVTGGTGMLGSYVVAHLRERDWQVRALVRPPCPRPCLEEWGVETTVGSLEDADSLVRAARGCDVIFHTAAAIGAGGDWATFFRGNVEGTANVVRAAEATGARLVHVSSTAVYGRERYRDEPTDEAVPLPTLPSHDVYGRSKQEAEALVLSAHEDGRICCLSVRPPVMYGRRDRQFAPRIGPVLERGLFPRVGGGRTTLTLVHARSVAEGMLLVATNEAAGGRAYLLANDHPVTVTDLVRCAEQGLERDIWAPEVPVLVGRAGFVALRAVLAGVGRGDLARHAHGTLEMLTRDNPFTSNRAREELGWAPSACPDNDLADALRWWRTYRTATPTSGR